MSLPAWHEISDRLSTLGAPISAAESHGLLCGLLCMRAPDARAQWIRRSLDDDGAQAAPAPLDRLYDETLAQLDDASFDFQLLLPADDELDLAGRTAALADWCNGFAFGVGAAGCDRERLPAQSLEFLQDITRIAQAEVAGEEDGEADYAEVAEYVRMGVLLARTENAVG